MKSKTFNLIRSVVTMFVGMTVAIAVVQGSYILAAAGVITGMLALTVARSKAKITVDERELTVRQKAAQMTYAIFAPTLAIGAFLMFIPSKSGISVFAKGEFVYLESLGMVFAYLALFLIALYAISYHFFNKKYGGGGDEE